MAAFMSRWRVLEAEEVVQGVPYIVVGAMPGLTLADVHDNNHRTFVFVWNQGSLRSERQSVPPVQTHTAHDGLERPAQSVRPQDWVARVDSKLATGVTIARSLTGELIDLSLDRRRDEDVERSKFPYARGIQARISRTRLLTQASGKGGSMRFRAMPIGIVAVVAIVAGCGGSNKTATSAATNPEHDIGEHDIGEHDIGCGAIIRQRHELSAARRRWGQIRAGDVGGHPRR